MEIHTTLYTYRANVLKVIDGDTLELDIDLGFSFTFAKQRARIRGINAPEITGKTRSAGLAAKLYLERLLNNKAIYIRTHLDKREKYGRLLVDVYITNLAKDGTPENCLDIATEMIRKGYAVEFK